jgi:hypothetical protein
MWFGFVSIVSLCRILDDNFIINMVTCISRCRFCMQEHPFLEKKISELKIFWVLIEWCRSWIAPPILAQGHRPYWSHRDHPWKPKGTGKSDPSGIPLSFHFYFISLFLCLSFFALKRDSYVIKNNVANFEDFKFTKCFIFIYANVLMDFSSNFCGCFAPWKQFWL